ncbi:hypothetical protein C8J56DRAFT_1099917 [Mycena floridula]|nr:hypothetical protein C8J56DRAFT_1099917 [Mycena floridula]
MSEPAVNPVSTIGPEQIGVIAGAWMFGLFTVQTYNYYQNFPEDRRYLRIIVAVLFVLELIHVVLSVVALFSVSVINYGKPGVILYIHPAISFSLIISAIVGPGVQIFYANRVRILSGSKIIPMICYFLSFVRAVSLLGVCIAAKTTPFIPVFRDKFDWLILSSIGVSTTVDIMIAVSLCYLLWKRRDHGVKSTQKKIDSLIMFSINTGLLTSVASIMMLVFFVSMANFAWLTMLLVIPRLFANSLLASLNSRAALARNTSGSYHTSPLGMEPHTTSYVPHFKPQLIEIEMTKTQHIMTESAD